jgi:membrane protein implicated in regulation of membrane protease activity
MRIFFLITFLIGLLLGVRSMLVGIVRSQQLLRRAPIFNLPSVGALLTVLGVTGYLIDRYTELGAAPTLAIAAGSGLAAAVATFSVIAGWAVPSAVRFPEDPRFELQGHPGTVVRAVPPEGQADGEIEYEFEDRTHRLPARSLSGDGIEVGTEIVIERIEDGVAHVELWSVIEREIGTH